MTECCRHCHHWQGRREQTYGDCYMILVELIPNFSLCHNDQGYGFEVPFDPHEVKYYSNSLTFKKLYRKLTLLPLNDKVEKEIVKELDFVYDSFGRKYLKTVSLLFLRTRRNYKCNSFKQRGGYNVWKKEE